MAGSKTDRKGFLATIGGWIRRMFMGASKDVVDVFEVEKLESPSRMAVKAFFRRKLAVTALVVLILLFAFVFIGSLIVPMDLTYTDPLQANVPPIFSMMRVPSALKRQIRDINGFSDFTVGVGQDDTLYLWGLTKSPLTKVNYRKMPEEIRPGNVLMASAGSDHIIAITVDGEIIGWGSHSRAQYGEIDETDTTGIRGMRTALADFAVEENGKTRYVLPDTGKIGQLLCGYQTTALVYDHRLYMWGNEKTCLNMTEVADNEEYSQNVRKVALSNYRIVVLKEDGTITGGRNMFYRESAKDASGTTIKNFQSAISGHVRDIAATDNCYAFLLDDGQVMVNGAAKHGENEGIVMPPKGESYRSLSAGTGHFVGVTDQGHVYAWGDNQNRQCRVQGADGEQVFTGAKQTYVTDSEGRLTKKAGMKGYLFGTDDKGRDTFTRIIHGGKMTMTIGSVAVIVSSIIAIIVGCLSGYFGGWVDMLLMRLTEIVGSIPFLPFAMLLSYVIQTKPIGETMRIFIIMMILGILSWTGLARMIRGQVLAEREKEFVIAAKAMGVRETRIAFKHILPNVMSIILVSMTLDFAGCLLTESGLSYLGFGVQQPRPTWGNMLYGARNSLVIQNYWWQWVFPSIFLSLATVSINTIGDALQDVLNPKSSREK